MSAEDSESGFKVQDRRRFDADGQPRDDSGGEASATAASSSRPVPITFSSFVIGLATQALLFLGAGGPASGGEGREGEAPAPNPAEAGAIIDILEMLAAKTKGNLSEDEARLIEDVLYDLRMRYVRETRRGAEGRGEARE